MPCDPLPLAAPTLEADIRPEYPWAGSSLVGVLLESRDSPLLVYTVTAALSNLPQRARVQVFHSAANTRTLYRSLMPLVQTGKVVLTLLGCSKFDPNGIMTRPAFWRAVVGEQVIIFQLDGSLCGHGAARLEEYLALGYDYIGAPWNRSTFVPHTGHQTGNGGFSLRSRSAHLAVTLRFPYSSWYHRGLRDSHVSGWSLHEDVYFAHFLPFVGGRVAPPHIAAGFSVESVFHASPVGAHAFYKQKDSLDVAHVRHLLHHCPELIPVWAEASAGSFSLSLIGLEAIAAAVRQGSPDGPAVDARAQAEAAQGASRNGMTLAWEMAAPALAVRSRGGGRGAAAAAGGRVRSLPSPAGGGAGTGTVTGPAPSLLAQLLTVPVAVVTADAREDDAGWAAAKAAWAGVPGVRLVRFPGLPARLVPQTGAAANASSSGSSRGGGGSDSGSSSAAGSVSGSGSGSGGGLFTGAGGTGPASPASASSASPPPAAWGGGVDLLASELTVARQAAGVVARDNGWASALLVLSPGWRPATAGAAAAAAATPAAASSTAGGSSAAGGGRAPFFVERWAELAMQAITGRGDWDVVLLGSGAAEGTEGVGEAGNPAAPAVPLLPGVEALGAAASSLNPSASASSSSAAAPGAVPLTWEGRPGSPPHHRYASFPKADTPAQPTDASRACPPALLAAGGAPAYLLRLGTRPHAASRLLDVLNAIRSVAFDVEGEAGAAETGTRGLLPWLCAWPGVQVMALDAPLLERDPAYTPPALHPDVAAEPLLAAQRRLALETAR